MTCRPVLSVARSSKPTGVVGVPRTARVAARLSRKPLVAVVQLMMEKPDIARAIDKAPIVRCPGCHVDMTLRRLEEPQRAKKLYSATYRCPKCGTETTRQFAIDH
jgi:hypothetical protein